LKPESGLARLQAIGGILRCPDCRGALETAAAIACKPCERTFPCVAGTPILLPSGVAAEAVRNDPVNRPTRWRHTRAWLRKRLPNIVLNVGTKRAAGRFASLVARQSARPLILNIGEKHAGPLLHALDAIPHTVHLRVDRALARDTDLCADCTRLPFADACADAVVVDSWLEHVSEPVKAVAEIRRVLKADGLVYIDLPFMMPVHGGPTDFYRFTALGAQALFRDFEVLERGV
jgi:SAM-dependent methyltransferase